MIVDDSQIVVVCPQIALRIVRVLTIVHADPGKPGLIPENRA